jgi:hypothetical protein
MGLVTVEGFSRKAERNVKFWREKTLTLVLSEKKILNETKNHNPPLQVK